MCREELGPEIHWEPGEAFGQERCSLDKCEGHGVATVEMGFHLGHVEEAVVRNTLVNIA